MTILGFLVGAALAGPVVLDGGQGPRLRVERRPAAEGRAVVWLRCDWTVRRSEGTERRATCGGEGVLAWTWDAGAFTWRLETLASEPGCPAAGGLAGSTWSGAVDGRFVVQTLRTDPADTVLDPVAGDLLAELGDTLQRLVVPIPGDRLRDGAVWTLRVREQAEGLTADVTDRWTATRADRTAADDAVRLAWQEEATLTSDAVETQPTVERWSGDLRLSATELLAAGRWESERPLRVVQGPRWIESVARCRGELRPGGVAPAAEPAPAEPGAAERAP